MTRPWLIPVGGFLGVGKTTLIVSAARILAQRNLKCAAIMNDQAGDLVDTAYAEANGLTASEVTGGCFCCRFSDLIHAADQLRAYSPDVIFLEPVGSCTDLSATILQPLKHNFASEYRLAPLTVLIDPTRTYSDPDTAFLYERQCAEADIILHNVRDRPQTFHSVNARTGEGLAAWLDELLAGSLPVGSKILEIDYAQYARAEAALGWLNWSATLHVQPALSPASLIGPWLDYLQHSLNQRIVHLKLFDQTPTTYLKAALTSSSLEPSVEGDLTASPESTHSPLRLNLRALIDPESLRTLFTESLVFLPGDRSDEAFSCFSPRPLNPNIATLKPYEASLSLTSATHVHRSKT